MRLPRICIFVCLGLAVAGCATEHPLPQSQASSAVAVPPAAGIYKIGKPYQIDNVWYYPHEQPDYDETGIASWYGPTFYGKYTADGEIYDGDKLTAAHRTLPMPVNVRVTDLENGKSIVVRVNDRGPYSRGRIIDLSRRAAELLGMVQAGTARVRVTYLGRADLGNGAPPPPETPPEIASALPAAPTAKVESSSLATVPGAATARPVKEQSMPVPVDVPLTPIAADQPGDQVIQMAVPAKTRLYVQVGAFSKLENARMLLARLGGDLRISTLQRNGQTLYRVRTGPLNSVEDADAELNRITGAGSSDAQIVVDQ
jgi:peptidoglycan lytic transglycosylase